MPSYTQLEAEATNSRSNIGQAALQLIQTAGTLENLIFLLDTQPLRMQHWFEDRGVYCATVQEQQSDLAGVPGGWQPVQKLSRK